MKDKALIGLCQICGGISAIDLDATIEHARDMYYPYRMIVFVSLGVAKKMWANDDSHCHCSVMALCRHFEYGDTVIEQNRKIERLMAFILDYMEDDIKDVDAMLDWADIDKKQLLREGMELVGRLLKQRQDKYT